MFTLGHDAECFARDSTGRVHTAIGKVGGTKEDPSKCKLGALQEDNVMAEMNITPAKSRKEFIKNTLTVREELNKRLAKYDLESYVVPSAEFEDADLDNAQAYASGCCPDYDAWAMCENPIIELHHSNTRYAGGHIHIGVDYANEPAKVTRLVRRLDASLGVGMLCIFGISDRFKAYGRFGAHRPKPYGVEYRSMDNSWLLHEAYMEWVWQATYFAAVHTDGEPNVSVEQLNKYVSTKDYDSLRDVYSSHSMATLPEVYKWS